MAFYRHPYHTLTKNLLSKTFLPQCQPFSPVLVHVSDEKWIIFPGFKILLMPNLPAKTLKMWGMTAIFLLTLIWLCWTHSTHWMSLSLSLLGGTRATQWQLIAAYDGMLKTLY